jgi:predicted PurR-regulated permease PerM
MTGNFELRATPLLPPGLARPYGERRRMRGTRRNPWRWFTDERVTYALKILMLLVLAFYAGQFVLEILVRLKTVVYILIGSIFLAYLIYPGVQWLRRRMPLVVAILIVYAAIITGFAVAALFIVPHIVADVEMLVAHYPDIAARFHSLVYNPGDPVTSRLPAWMRNEIARSPAAVVAWIKTRGVETFGRFATMLAGTVAAIAVFIVVPVVTAYLLLDLDHLKASIAEVVPSRRWSATAALAVEIEQVIGGFIRGQLLVALVVGILITIALLLLRVPYAYLFGLLAAIGDLIPYVGAVLAFLPAFGSAVVANGWVNGLLVTVAFVAIYEVEGHLIAPNVVGRQVRLSAFVVIIALLIGADLAGLFGMLVAIPIAGVLRVLIVRVVEAAKSKAAA